MSTIVKMPSDYAPTDISTIPSKVSKLRRTFQTGKTKPLSYRKEQLYKLHEFLTNEKDGIIEALYKDLRKPPAESHFAEISSVKAEVVDALLNLDEWAEPRNAEKPIAFVLDRVQVRRVPLGVVLIIGTWNYPVNLTLAPLVAAIAGGNCAIIKFNEVCQHTSAFLAHHLPNYLDKDAFEFVLGEIPETTALLENQFDLIFYTGNSMVARIIHKAANKFLTPTVLELGGKSPMIVDEDVHVAHAAKRIAWAKVLNNGSTCVAPDYVLLHRKVKAEFVEEYKKSVIELIGADAKNSNRYGRISSDRHWDRLDQMLKDQLKVPGTELAFGGQRDRSDRFFAPTLLTGVGKDPTQNPIMKDEIFGPILPVIEVDSVDEAIDYVNTRPNPLSYNPFSNNPKTIQKVFDNINGGNALANDAIVFLLAPDYPFGGSGESGMGTYHGIHGFETFTRKQGTLVRPLWTDLPNVVRYQNISYDRSSWGFWALIFASEPGLPSKGYVQFRNVMRHLKPYLLFTIYVGLLFCALLVGMSIRK
jgi:aldehyde dehydrogenase (NAD+)